FAMEIMEATTKNSAPVLFTSGAIEEINKLMQGEGFDHSKFRRIGVKGAGCSGLSYILAFDEKKNNDEESIINWHHCIINPAHGIYVFGMEIDWKNGLDARGFVFTNPNASSTCGCGSSFAV